MRNKIREMLDRIVLTAKLSDTDKFILETELIQIATDGLPKRRTVKKLGDIEYNKCIDEMEKKIEFNADHYTHDTNQYCGD